MIVGIFLGNAIFGAGILLALFIFLILSTISAVFKQKHILILCLSICTGLFLLTAATPTNQIEGTCTLNGTIADVPEYKNGTWSATLKDASCETGKLSGKIHLSIKDDNFSGECGDVISVQAYLSVPESTRNEGAIDWRMYYLGKGITMTAEALNSCKVTASKGPGIYGTLLKMKDVIEQKIESLFPSNPDLVKGLLLGDTDSIDNKTMEAFRTTGTAHLLAISGLNISIIAEFIKRLMKRAKPSLRLAVIAPFLLCYLAITAFPTSLLRAAIMAIIMLSAEALGKRYDSPTSLSIAAIFILVISPYQLFSAGFLLSFSACLTMILLLRPLSQRLRFMPKPIAESIAVTASATAGTIPFSAAYFNSIPLLTLPANMLVVPISLIAMIPAILAVAFSMFFPGIARLIALGTDALLTIMRFLITLISSSGVGSLDIAAPSIMVCVPFFLSLFALSDFLLRPSRIKRTVFSLFIALCVFAASLSYALRPEVRVSIPETSSGKAVQISIDSEQYILYPAGAVRELTAICSTRGNRKIKAIFVSSEADIKAAEELSQELDVTVIYNCGTIKPDLETTTLDFPESTQLTFPNGLQFSNTKNGLTFSYQTLTCSFDPDSDASVHIISDIQNYRTDTPATILLEGKTEQQAHLYSTEELGQIDLLYNNKSLKLRSFSDTNN